jgi:hypothetical protein
MREPKYLSVNRHRFVISHRPSIHWVFEMLMLSMTNAQASLFLRLAIEDVQIVAGLAEPNVKASHPFVPLVVR